MRDHIVNLDATMTQPETAWLVNMVPVALAVAALIIVTFLLRDQLKQLILAATLRRAHSSRQGLPAAIIPDAALYWTPPAVPAQQFLLICASAALLLLVGMSVIMPMFLALVLSAPLAALVVWGGLRLFEARYVRQLDKGLVAAVGRMSAMLRSGNSYRQMLEKLLGDMEEGPLKQEWSFLLELQGVPLTGRDGIATPQQVVAALAIQTPSRRHATFLNHLTVAVGQPQDVLMTRVAGAYLALQASERRAEEAKTELAQMQYSGLAVGCAGLFMAAYLMWTQWDRVVVAYSTPLGAIVGLFVAASLLLPVVGGMLLARADDVDY